MEAENKNKQTKNILKNKQMNKVISDGEKKCVESKPESHLGSGILVTHSDPNEVPNHTIIFFLMLR